jgi:hypothetical protein
MAIDSIPLCSIDLPLQSGRLIGKVQKDADLQPGRRPPNVQSATMRLQHSSNERQPGAVARGRPVCPCDAHVGTHAE